MGAEVNKFLKGMNKDNPQIDQPDNTYRDAVNAVIDSKVGAICSDIGNELTSTIVWKYYNRGGEGVEDINFSVIGNIPIPGDAFILFGVAQLNSVKFSGIFYLSDKTTLIDSPGAELGVGNQWVMSEFAITSNININIDNNKRIIPLFISTDKGYSITTVSNKTIVNFDVTKDNPLGYLNFDKYHPVTGEFKVLSNGNLIIYFTDNKYTKVNFEDYLTGGTTPIGVPTSEYDYIIDYNPPRAFNVTKQLKSLASDYARELSLYPNSINPNGIHIDRLNMFTDSGRIPIIELDGINLGGGLKTGAYYLGLAYSDEEGFETNVLTLAPPVYIVPNPDDTFPIESITGAPAGTQTNKSIRWEIKNSNIEYKYLVPYVVQLIGNDLKAIKLEVVDTYSPLGSPIYVTYTGIEKVATESVDKIIIDKVRYLTSKVMAQLDNKLYLANMTARKDLGYQRFANNIKVAPVTREMQNFDNRRYDIYNINEGYSQLIFPDNNTTDKTLYTKGTNFNGDGVIANEHTNFIAATYNDWHDNGEQRDGTAPYEYLATRLGRVDAKYLQSLTTVQSTGNRGYRDPFLNFSYKSFRRQEVYAFYISFVLKDGSESYAYHIPGQEIPEEYMSWDNIDVSGFNSGEIVVSRPNSKPYQYIDTSLEDVDTSNGMGHWENESEIYPDTNDFDIWTVDNVGNAKIDTNSLRGKNVRHHKMPGNKGNYSYIKRGKCSTPDIDQDSDDLIESRDIQETVRILGVRVSNIKIPKVILKQIQGYKIYFAKRTQVNKTILGQSLMHPANLYLAANFSATLDIAKDGPYFNVWAFEGRHLTSGVHTKSAWLPNNAYLGQPVAKFHDFNLLKNKHSLAGATHIDLQYIVTMHHWRGGYKNAIPSELNSTYQTDPYYKGTLFYKLFRDGYGEGEYSWIHADLGNLTNANYDLTILNNDNIPTYEEFYNVPGVRIPWGQVFVAGAYWIPGQYNSDPRAPVTDVGSKFSYYTSASSAYPLDYINDTASTANFYQTWLNTNGPTSLYEQVTVKDNNGVPWNDTIASLQKDIINPKQTIFMLEPNSATYVNGVSLLKPADAASYKGASYLSNLYGETGIALGMVSGPPVLGGYGDNRWTFENIVLDASRKVAQEGIAAYFGGTLPFYSAEYAPVGGGSTSYAAGYISSIRNITIFGTYDFNGSDYFEMVNDPGLAALSINGGNVLKYTGPIAIELTYQYQFKYGTYRHSNEGSCPGGCGGASPCGDRENANYTIKTYKKSSQEGSTWQEVNITSRTFYEDDNQCGAWPVLQDSGGYGDTGNTVSFPVTLHPEDTIITYIVPLSDVGDEKYGYEAQFYLTINSLGVSSTNPQTNNGYWLETFLLDERLKVGLKNLILRTVTKDHHVLRQEETSKGRPNMYLINLCAEKSDVFEPFDQQKLVWTGVYRDLSNADIETGEVAAYSYKDIQSGNGKKDTNVPNRAPTSSSADFFTPNPACAGDWVTFTTESTLYGPTLENVTHYFSLDNSGPILQTKNPTGGLGRQYTIEIQIPAGTSPGIYPITIHKGPDRLTTNYIAIVDCSQGDPVQPNTNLYKEGDTIDVFGGDTYICRYSYRTTSFDYPLNRLIKGPNALYQDIPGSVDDYIFGDTPLNIGAGKSGDYPVMSLGGDTSNISLEEKRKLIIQNKRNWTWGNYDLFSTVFEVMVESDDNLNYRHIGDVSKGVTESSSLYFDKGLAADIVFKTPLKDLTKQDNLLYESHYSAVQDLRVTIPFPKRGRTVSLFPNRIIRSNIQTGSFVDSYRTFLALEYKDIALNRGPINNIFVLESLLYIHTEKSLFKTQGKQTVELNDASEAFVGSGDIFIRDVVEILYQSNDGYMGLYDKTGSILTKDGYMFLSYNARKLFLIGGKEEVKDLTLAGMSRWFIDNIPFKYDKYYGMNSILLANSPNIGFGFTLGYDPIYKRVFLTKLDLETTLPITNDETIPDAPYLQLLSSDNLTFLDNNKTLVSFEEGEVFTKTGWTISFSTELGAWSSRHTYQPYMYMYNSKAMYTLSKENAVNSFWKHTEKAVRLQYYGNSVYNFEIDMIFPGEDKRSVTGTTTTKNSNKVFSAFAISSDSFQEGIDTMRNVFNIPFSKFYVYNSFQISGLVNINYLENLRRVDGSWVINEFRDVAKYGSTPDSLATFSPGQGEQMFTSEGVINVNYIDNNKDWYNKRKFVDKWIGLRLIYNSSVNTSTNLVYLYNVVFNSRPSFR